MKVPYFFLATGNTFKKMPRATFNLVMMTSPTRSSGGSTYVHVHVYVCTHTYVPPSIQYVIISN